MCRTISLSLSGVFEATAVNPQRDISTNQKLSFVYQSVGGCDFLQKLLVQAGMIRSHVTLPADDN